MKKICILMVAVIVFAASGSGFAAESQDSDGNATSTVMTPAADTQKDSANATLAAGNASLIVAAKGAASANSTEEIIPADYKEVGYASWYGKKFHGKLTASGKPYDMEKFTAAHNYLPLGVKVKVTNLSNNKTVVVTINDRGPFVPDRILDLSRAAGEKIGLLKDGKAKVRIEAYRPESEGDSVKSTITPAKALKDIYGAFYIQVGAFKVKSNADLLVTQIEKLGFSKYRVLRIVNDNSQVFKVQIGMFKSLSKAREALGKLGKGFPGSFVMADVVQE